MFFNLIRNAIQASSSGQKVIIRVCELHELKLEVPSSEDSGDFICVQVIDQGCGISDKALPHIFEPFFTTKGKIDEGMGLGLSVTRNLIESFGGRIEVQTSPGSGSTFSIVMPRSFSEATA